jgi:predicted transcriptional regulator
VNEEELIDVLRHLYQLGLVNVEYDENLEAKFSITEEGKKVLQQHYGDQL